MPIAIVLIVLVVGTVLFHLLSPWWFTEIASNWGAIDATVLITVWVTGTVFVAVNLFLAYSIFRFRERKGSKAHYEPESTRLEVWLTVATTVGIIAMLAPGLFVWAKVINVPDDAIEVEVVGQQWNFSFRLPGEDGILGTTDARRISVDNPFGLIPDDPHGLDDVLVEANEVYLPVGRPVRLQLRAKDVLHNFTVPQFRMKMDMVPGMVTHMWVTPSRTGRFEILCEQYCGIAHHVMRGRVVVVEEDEFRDWLARQATFGEMVAQAPGDPEAGQQRYAPCAACHGAQGEGNQQMNAPRLAGQDAWYLRRQMDHFRQGVRGAHEDDIFGRQMAPMAGVVPDRAALNDLIAYIETMPDRPAAPTLAGDARRGERLYRTCARCHGPQGQGVWSAEGPRLAGVDDWYLARQLENFQRGIRGAHPDDFYGWQMGMMAAILKDDQAVNDVIAYISSLR